MSDYWGAHIPGMECPCKPTRVRRIRQAAGQLSTLIVEVQHTIPDDILERRELGGDELVEEMERAGQWPIRGGGWSTDKEAAADSWRNW